MMEIAQSALPKRFGNFEFDPRARQLHRHGHRIRLHGQPLEILGLLLERPAEVVLREEIRARLWPEDTFVDFEHSLNAAVNKLREALGDDANNPRFIETVPRRGYRFIAPIERVLPVLEPDSTNQGAPAVPAMRMRLRWAVTTAGIALVGLLVVGTLFWARNSRVRWARNQALPEIARLVDQGKFDAGFRLAQQAEHYIPNDPLLLRLLHSFTVPISIQTNPPGADIYLRAYSAGDDDWLLVGRSPLENVRVPWAYFRWKIVKQGFGTVEAAPFLFPNLNMHFTLDATGTSPAGMVRVPGGTFQFRSADPVELENYWIDKYEVTNRQFKVFMTRGGYQHGTHWKHEFIKNGRRLSWEDAMAEFKDSTGRVAPSTWELGTYPEGQSDFPASGVSWYEAAAYCESEGKSLPTIYHWYKAAGLGVDSDVLHFSNFSGKGPARIGDHQGLGPYGTYDMAGNVKEWTWNEAGTKRYILGGAWNEPSYTFAIQDAQSPFGRSATFGFRCAKYGAPLAAGLTRPIETLARDYTREKPVPESVFSFYKSLYSYDHTELDPRLESVDDSSNYWRREKVSFRAAYGNERVTGYLFLPKNVRPPYAVVIYFPGVSSFFEKSSAEIKLDLLEFAVRSGRAVLCRVGRRRGPAQHRRFLRPP
ncbi:MAG TPA: SUMF1/EgtB/PvdO family nonheme iron enzyme [Candidatus Acidoferrum sp.]